MSRLKAKRWFFPFVLGLAVSFGAGAQTLTAPVLSTPTNGATGQATALTLMWDTVSTAISYTVQISTGSAFAVLTVNQPGLTTASYAAPVLSPGTTYYWQVNAVNAADSTSAWSTVWSFTTLAVPATPTLAAPANAATGEPTSLTLGWNSAARATSYEAQVSTGSTFAATVFDQSGLTGSPASVSGLSDGTLYYWRIDAANSNGTSAWSTVRHFTTAFTVPTLTSPTNGTTGLATPLTLMWGTVASAVSYSVQVSTGSGFTSLAFTSVGLTADSSSVATLPTGTTYYWRANATNGTLTSAWTTAWTFATSGVALAAPVLSSPTNASTAVVTPLTLQWGTVAGAANYSLEVSTGSTFAVLTVNQTGLSSNAYAVTSLAAGTTYYWMANAAATSSLSPWSTVWSFTTLAVPATPTLAAPANTAVNQATSLTLSWNAAARATSYEAEVSTGSTFAATVFDQAGLTGSPAAVSGLSVGTMYYWRVDGSDAAGTSAWSTVRSFTTAFTAPTLSSPTNGDTGLATPLTLMWGTVASAVSYSVQVSTGSGFTSLAFSSAGLTADSFSVAALPTGTTYYWRANATNGTVTSAWTTAWSFAIGGVALAAPALSSPTNASTAVLAPLTLQWGTVAGAATYALEVSTGSTFAVFTVNQTGLTANAYAVTSLAAGTTYYWMANAAATGSLSPWSPIWHFTTLAVPATPTLAAPANAAVNQATALTLSWNAAARATSYEAQVSTGSTFAATVFDQAGLTGSPAAVSGLSAGIMYYWRVDGSDTAGTSAWSTVRSFTTAFTAPMLSSPTNGATGLATALTLQWGTVTTAISYSLGVSTSSTFATTVSSQTGLTATSSMVTGLANGITYYWRANATNGTANSAWSSVWSFTTGAGAPAAPVLSAPANNAANQATSLTLSWVSSALATTYAAQVSTVSTFATTVFSQTGLAVTFIGVGGLSNGTTYYWQVNATNTVGTSSWSGAWSFTTTARFVIPLINGWNIYSLNIHPTDSTTVGVFSGLKGLVVAEDENDNLYWPAASEDEIDTIHTGIGYWIYDTLSTDTLKLTGAADAVASTPISLPASSWKLVAYLPQADMPPATALASISSQLVIAMDGGGDLYWPGASEDQIDTMDVGQGYYIVTNAAATLTYPAGAGAGLAKQLAAAAGKPLLRPSPLKHYAKHSRTGNFAVFLARNIEFGGKLAADKCEVGGFDTKGNLVGAGTVVNGQAAFAIWGKDQMTKAKNGCDPSEKISFRLWNGQKEYPLEVSGASDPIYKAKAILIVTLAVPAKAIITSFDLPRVYPNPFRGRVGITFDVPVLSGAAAQEVEIGVYDMRGSLVQRLVKGRYPAGSYTVSWNGRPSSGNVSGSGIYIVRMKANGFDKRLKLIELN